MPPINYKEKYGENALIIGSSQTIGEQFARQLAAKGMNVYLVARNQQKLHSIAADIQAQHNVQAQVISLDLLAEGALDKLKALTDAIDISYLVINANMHKMNHLHRLNETYKAGMLQMNILMPTYLCDHYGQKMIARGKGCIFLTGALNYTMAIEKDSIFQGSKAYISAFAESLWLEYRRFGVDVCTGLISGIEGSESYEAKSSELSRKLLHYSGGSMQADFIVQKCLQDIEKGKSYAIPDYLFPVSKIIYLFIAINKVLRSRRYARMLNHLLHKVLNGKGASE